MARLEPAVQSGGLLKLYQALWAPYYQAVLNILGSTGTILPIGDPHHGQPNATTLTTKGEEQVTFTWSEAPGSFDTPLDLTDPDSFQGIVPVVEFNGTDEEADTGSALITSYALSWGAWVRLETGSGDHAFMGISDISEPNVYYTLGFNPSNAPVLTVRNTTSVSATGTALALNTWHHIVGVLASATDRKLYVDGAQDAISTTSVTLAAGNDVTTLAMRRRSTGHDSYFPGSIAGGPLSPFLTQVELTADQVRALYDLGRAALAL